jgi:hypothetical protein
MKMTTLTTERLLLADPPTGRLTATCSTEGAGVPATVWAPTLGVLSLDLGPNAYFSH